MAVSDGGPGQAQLLKEGIAVERVQATGRMRPTSWYLGNWTLAVLARHDSPRSPDQCRRHSDQQT